MQLSDELDDANPAPRRRSRLLVAGLVLFGTMVVLGRVMPGILAILR